MKRMFFTLLAMFMSVGMIWAQDFPEPQSSYVIYGTGGKQLDLGSGETLEVCDNFTGVCRNIRFDAYENLLAIDPEVTIDEALGVRGGVHTPTSLTFHTQVEDNIYVSREDWLSFCHSGRGYEVNGSCEQYRQYMEGSRWSPSEELRDQRLLEIVDGEHFIYVHLTSGEVMTFVVKEAVYISEEELQFARDNDMAIYGEVRNASYDIFLQTDRAGTRDWFLVFCSSSGGSNPADRYDARFVWRLEFQDD